MSTDNQNGEIVGIKRDLVMMSIGIILSYGAMLTLTHSVPYTEVERSVKALCSHKQIDAKKVVVKTTFFGDIIVRCDGKRNESLLLSFKTNKN